MDGDVVPASIHPGLKTGEAELCGLKVWDLIGLACQALFRVDVGFITPPESLWEIFFQTDWPRAAADMYDRAHPPRLRLIALRAYELYLTPSCLVVHGKDYNRYIASWMAVSIPSILRFSAKSALESGGVPFDELMFVRLTKVNMSWWAKRENLEVSKQKKYSGDRAASLALGEIAFLSLLTSTHPGVCRYACAGLMLLAVAEHHPEAPRTTHFSENVQAKRLLVYERILETVDTLWGLLFPII
jgi:hypothetical protein